MSVRRALVDCVVLSVQDARLFYPCCRGCLSRIDVEQQDTTRCRCSRCGYSCLRDQVDHRYRLSLKVARDRCIFGVTVFGACLNPFFGIHASGLQRLVEDLDGPVEASTRSTLLLKSVEDCFIGRHFIFGLKLPETESGPWLRGPVWNGSSTKDTPHFIASQMILPKATGLGGCTVVSYYQILLQKAASTDPSKTSGPPATTLLLLARQSPARSFNDGTLCASGLFSQSLLRSQDSTLTPTPPWQQSLGLVTSSAEQEEGCSSQDSGDDNSRQTDFKTPHRAQTVCLEDHKVTEEKVLSPVLSLECSSYNHPFAKYPHPSIEEAVGKSPTLNTWFSPSPPGHNSSKGKCFSTRQVNKTFLPSSLAWEDLPFSESLTEFLCEENKDLDIVCETKPHHVQNHKETARNNLEIRSQDKNLSVSSTSVRQTNTEITDSNSQMLPDITYSPAPNGGGKHDLSEQVCKNPVGCLNKSQARNICLHECNQEDEKASSLSFENEEEQLEGDAYDCSADLFSSSLMTDMNSNTLTTQEETVRTNTEVCPVRSTPDNQRPKHNKCINRDSLIPLGTQDLDFIPPSQSTPIVKVAVVSRSPASSHGTWTLGQDSCAFNRNLPELDSKKAAKNTTPLSRFNCVGANQLSHCDRESTKENQVWGTTSSKHRFTPKRRFWKPDKHKIHMLAQQHPRVQKEALKTASTGGINHKCDSSACDVTVCEYEASEEIVVPPTPAVKTQQSVKLRRRRLTDDGSSTLGFTWEGQQGGGVKCKRTLLDQTLTSSQRDLVQTGNSDSETVAKRSLDASSCYILDDENEACDWSRDLFSDSV